MFKAEAALDAASTRGDAASKATISNKDSIQTKLEFATALGYLGQSNFERAAYTFLKLGPAKGLGDWLGKVYIPATYSFIANTNSYLQLVSAGDIAIYGTLCALASLSRSAIKATVVDNATFGVYVEQEPYVRELVDAYMSSKFKIVLEILERFLVSLT